MPIEYFNERVNLYKLRTIIDNWNELPMPEDCKKEWVVKGKNGKTWTMNPLACLKKYMEGMKVLKNKPYAYRKVSYITSCSASANGYCKGRQYVLDGIGLQSFSKYIRNTICMEYYDDIDIVNCHSTFLLQLCKRKGWRHNAIEYYNDNRDKCLKDIMELTEKDRDEAKRDVIIAMYNNGGVSGKVNQLEWFQKYCADILCIQEHMYEDNEYAVAKEFAIEKNKYRKEEKRNEKGSLCSVLMNEIENEVLECCIGYLRSKKIDTSSIVKAFDGFQIPKGQDVDALCRELEGFVERELGWRISFLGKIQEHSIAIEGFQPVDTAVLMPYKPTDELDALVMESLQMEGSHYTVAKVVQQQVAGMFVSDREIFYVFDATKHIWLNYGEIMLREYLSRVIAPIYHNKCLDLQKLDNKDKADEAKEIYKKLQSAGYKDSILKELRSILFDAEFRDKLDDNKYLLGFTNGVYDLREHVFRDGKPDDYITKTVGFPYQENTEAHIVPTQELETFFKEIFPAEAETVFFKRRLAYCLSGVKTNQDSNLLFLIGVGGNGKGVCKILCESVFGDYCYSPHTNILSAKRSSSGASPDLVKMRGVRMMICEEPDDSDAVSTHDMKAWTGGGSIECRQLYSGDVLKFPVQFAMFVLMNNVINIKSLDGGFIRRLDNLEFPYKFVDHPLLPNEKALIRGLDAKFRDNVVYRQAFMNMLLKIWKEDKLLDGIEKPPSVKAFTAEYVYSQDTVRRFVDLMVETAVPVKFNDDAFVWKRNENFITADDLEKKYYSYGDNGNPANRKQRGWVQQQMKNLGFPTMKKTWRAGGCRNAVVYVGLGFQKEEEYDSEEDLS